MTQKEMITCSSIIHLASAAAGAVGAGLAQMPTSDNLIITPIQITMAISLGTVFGITIEESRAKAMVACAAATTIGRAASQVALGWIPVAGNVINAATAATITETMGWIIAEEFRRQRDILFFT